MTKRSDEEKEIIDIEALRFTMPDRPEMVCRLSRGRAPTAEELVKTYLAKIGRLGGLATRGVSTLRKRRASRANGKLGGRPRKGNKNAPETALEMTEKGDQRK